MRPFLRGFSAIDNKLHDEGMRLFSALEIAAYAQSVNAVHFYRRQLLGEDDSDHEESSISNSPQKLPPTVLLDAACNNNLAVFDYLLRSGSSDPTIGDEKRRLPLHMAAWCNNVAVLRLLIDGKFTALDVEDSAGKTALFYAVENDQRRCWRGL